MSAAWCGPTLASASTTTPTTTPAKPLRRRRRATNGIDPRLSFLTPEDFALVGDPHAVLAKKKLTLEQTRTWLTVHDEIQGDLEEGLWWDNMPYRLFLSVLTYHNEISDAVAAEDAAERAKAARSPR